MSVFLVNASDKVVKFMRNAKVITILPRQSVPVVDKATAEDIAFNNNSLRVVEQADEEQYFLHHNGPNVIVVRYDNTTYPFSNGKYTEVETRDKADTIAREFNAVSHSAVRFTVHKASELEELGVEAKDVVLLSAAEKPAIIE